jgi:hypothetical protein
LGNWANAPFFLKNNQIPIHRRVAEPKDKEPESGNIFFLVRMAAREIPNFTYPKNGAHFISEANGSACFLD